MMSLCHHPTNLVVYVSACTMSSAVDITVHMDLALNYSGVKPTCGPVTWTVAHSAMVISILCTVFHRFSGRLLPGG